MTYNSVLDVDYPTTEIKVEPVRPTLAYSSPIIIIKDTLINESILEDSVLEDSILEDSMTEDTILRVRSVNNEPEVESSVSFVFWLRTIIGCLLVVLFTIIVLICYVSALFTQFQWSGQTDSGVANLWVILGVGVSGSLLGAGSLVWVLRADINLVGGYLVLTLLMPVSFVLVSIGVLMTLLVAFVIGGKFALAYFEGRRRDKISMTASD